MFSSILCNTETFYCIEKTSLFCWEIEPSVQQVDKPSSSADHIKKTDFQVVDLHFPYYIQIEFYILKIWFLRKVKSFHPLYHCLQECPLHHTHQLFKLFTQPLFNDLVRNHDLTKKKSEVNARLRVRNFLEKNVKTAVYRNRHKSCACFYTTMYVCFYYDISGLLGKLGKPYDACERRLFVQTVAKKALRKFCCTIAIRSPQHPPHTPYI